MNDTLGRPLWYADTPEKIHARAGKMIAQGASILDIGGYSTRPGAIDIPTHEEIERVVPAIRTIRAAYPDVKISIDTFRSEVAGAALENGASMVNDVSGGTIDPNLWSVVRDFSVPYVLMHMRGTPQDMAAHTNYEHMLSDILQHLEERVQRLHAMGIEDVIIDPGFGFAKTREQNYYLLKNLGYFRALELPLLVGISRKSMIFRELEVSPAELLTDHREDEVGMALGQECEPLL